MDLTTTSIAAAVLLALGVFFGWRGAIGPDLTREPRLIPYRFLMVLSFGLLLVVVAHLVTLLGPKTP
jgi:hypothetical protein